jgi:hypothetical protein
MTAQTRTDAFGRRVVRYAEERGISHRLPHADLSRVEDLVEPDPRLGRTPVTAGWDQPQERLRQGMRCLLSQAAYAEQRANETWDTANLPGCRGMAYDRVKKAWRRHTGRGEVLRRAADLLGTRLPEQP